MEAAVSLVLEQTQRSLWPEAVLHPSGATLKIYVHWGATAYLGASEQAVQVHYIPTTSSTVSHSSSSARRWCKPPGTGLVGPHHTGVEAHCCDYQINQDYRSPSWRSTRGCSLKNWEGLTHSKPNYKPMLTPSFSKHDHCHLPSEVWLTVNWSIWRLASSYSSWTAVTGLLPLWQYHAKKDGKFRVCGTIRWQ